MRQREDLVSRLVTDVGKMKDSINMKNVQIQKIQAKYNELSADYSANAVLIDQYEENDSSEGTILF